MLLRRFPNTCIPPYKKNPIPLPVNFDEEDQSVSNWKVTLEDGTCFFVLKELLAAQSGFFEARFSGRWDAACTFPENPEVFKQMLLAIYGHDVKPTFDLMSVADKYCLDALKNQFMKLEKKKHVHEMLTTLSSSPCPFSETPLSQEDFEFCLPFFTNWPIFPLFDVESDVESLHQAIHNHIGIHPFIHNKCSGRLVYSIYIAMVWISHSFYYNPKGISTEEEKKWPYFIATNEEFPCKSSGKEWQTGYYCLFVVASKSGLVAGSMPENFIGFCQNLLTLYNRSPSPEVKDSVDEIAQGVTSLSIENKTPD